MPAITETPNELTDGLDSASPEGIVRLLRGADAQLFCGYRHHPSMLDQDCLQVAAQVAEVAAELLQEAAADPSAVRIVLAGSGTSGRMAFSVARTMNRLLQQPNTTTATGVGGPFVYLCAGGDPALFLSREAPEDNWVVGQEELARVTKDARRVLYIGITCGLSAPFVASQLVRALPEPDRFHSVLLGFNPPELARTVPIEGWDRTFSDVVQAMQTQAQADRQASRRPRAHLLTPVVGPEAVTGSTRMKGGSATKMLLEAIFWTAWAEACGNAGGEWNMSRRTGLIERILREYEGVVRCVYKPLKALGGAVQAAGQALRAGGRVVYLGAGGPGVCALIDASECPPTYNATADDVRAFLAGGFAALDNAEGDLAPRGPEFGLDWSHFQDTILDSMTSRDLVVVVDVASESGSLQERAVALLKGTPCSVLVLSVHDEIGQLGHGSWAKIGWPVVEVCLPSLDLQSAAAATTGRFSLAGAHGPEACLLGEMAVKLLLNAVSTGAHVLKGKVMANLMIDLQVSNNKLYHRSIGIVCRFAGCSESEGEAALQRAIHNVDRVDSKITSMGISQHIAAAAETAHKGVRVVPTAVVLAKQPALSFADVQQRLAQEPNVQQLLASLKSA